MTMEQTILLPPRLSRIDGVRRRVYTLKLPILLEEHGARCRSWTIFALNQIEDAFRFTGSNDLCPLIGFAVFDRAISLKFGIQGTWIGSLLYVPDREFVGAKLSLCWIGRRERLMAINEPVRCFSSRMRYFILPATSHEFAVYGEDYSDSSGYLFSHAEAVRLRNFPGLRAFENSNHIEED